jgi:hypothetical protein
MAESLKDLGAEIASPMQIASNALLTAKEKMDLLHKLKAEATGLVRNEDGTGFSPEEIDEAIEEVKLRAQNGEEPAFTPPGEVA